MLNSAKIVGIVLIVISLAAGYVGLNRIADSTKEINFLDLKIDASDESGQMQGFLYLAAAAALLAGGLYTLKKSNCLKQNSKIESLQHKTIAGFFWSFYYL